MEAPARGADNCVTAEIPSRKAPKIAHRKRRLSLPFVFAERHDGLGEPIRSPSGMLAHDGRAASFHFWEAAPPSSEAGVRQEELHP